MRARRGRWLLALVTTLALCRPALADDRFPVGTKEFSLAGGYSRSFNVDSVSGVSGFHLLPHYGVFVTDEGPGWAPVWLRGTLELIAEPTFIHLDTRESDNHGGVTALARWVFATEGIVRPYAEAGAGLLFGRSGIPQTDCEILFTLHAGAGILLFVTERNAVTLGTRFHHVSNGSACNGNFSLNSAVFMLGVSTFFP
jgi:lipid A 3-O-deacylase